MRVQPNDTNQTLYFTVMDADGVLGVAATLNSNIDDITLNYKTSATASTTSTALTALAAATTAHTDNYAYAVGPGALRVDLPDSPWAAGSSAVECWLTFAGTLADYEMAGGRQTIQLGYALQNPDSSTTALARESTVQAALATIDTGVDTINTSTGITIPATLATLATSSALATVDTVVDAILVDTDATIPGLLSTIDTVVDSILVDTGTTLPAQIDAIGGGGGGSGTISGEDVAPQFAFYYDAKSNAKEAVKPINLDDGDGLTIQFNLEGRLLPKDSIASVVSATYTTTGEETITLGTPSVHSSKRRVNVELSSLGVGTYTIALKYTTTLSQTETVVGTLVVTA